MTKQRSELDAWLGAARGTLGAVVDSRQAERVAAEIFNRYPDDKTEREVALTAALELLVEGDPEATVAGMGRDLAAARSQERAAQLRLGQVASMLVEAPSMENPNPKGVRSQSGFAKAAGVDRMTVLKWLGLR